MRNLLLEKDKRSLRREYFVRLVGMSLWFLFFSACIGVVSLLPSLFLSQVKKSEIESQLSITKESVALREQEQSAQALTEARQKLELIAGGGRRATASRTVADVVQRKPDGVFLKSIRLRVRGGDGGEVVITGVALRRDALLLFKRNLEKVGVFSSVMLPISNLASERDIEFSIQITGDF